MATKRKTKKKAKRNPAYSTKRGGIKARPSPNRRFSWIFSAHPVTAKTREKYQAAMQAWAKRNKVKIQRYGTQKGYLVAFITTSTKSIPKRRVVRLVGTKGAKLRLVGVPTTKKAKAAAWSNKYKKGSTVAAKKKRAKKVSAKTACKAGTKTCKKGYFRGTGKKGNTYAKGMYFKSA